MNERTKAKKLKNEGVKLDFQENLNEKLREYEIVQGEAEVIWRQFKNVILEAAVEVCSTACIGHGRRGTEQWNEDSVKLVEKKRAYYEITVITIWLTTYSTILTRKVR